MTDRLTADAFTADALTSYSLETVEAVLDTLAAEQEATARVRAALEHLEVLTRPYLTGEEDDGAPLYVWDAVARMTHGERLQALDHIHVLETEGVIDRYPDL
ncbi:hypothetical protein OG982_06110 [Streptomyces sp. NBC_01551]|uniref:hypothetical protein n=1 Tax=Streptomyces sp. NBC_01551 TaxID=2975876 RepID=UPI0022595144|nr:hypothetical protein [Streptomyces sp. NBC_01551]MCX4525267.1 hypothetical protein [Streptomyces sp. NBC_01551]